MLQICQYYIIIPKLVLIILTPFLRWNTFNNIQRVFKLNTFQNVLSALRLVIYKPFIKHNKIILYNNMVCIYT